MNTDELREALRRDAELAGRPPTDLVPRVAGLRRRSRRRATGVVAIACAIVAAVVGVSVIDGARGQGRGDDAAAGVDLGGAATATIDPEADAARLRALIDGAYSNRDYVFVPGSLAEYLPNRRYRGPDGRVTTLTDAVVVGRVVSVTPGRAHYWPEDDEAGPGIEVPFDDPRATSRTVHAEVAVTEVIAGEVTQRTIVVGFGIGTSSTELDTLTAGLPALGDLVLFLRRSGVFGYDPAVWGVAEDGAMLAEVEDGGRLSFPAIEPYRAERYLARNPTVDSLRAAGRQPTIEVPLETLGD